MALLQLTVVTVLAAHQVTCETLESQASAALPSLVRRTLQQDYVVEGDDVEIQQRDPSAICAVRSGLTATCNPNCRVCTFNPNVPRNSRTCRCCRPGFFSPSYTTPGTLCQECPRGQFQPASGATTCRVCPRSTTNLGSFRANCTACPEGRFAVPVTLANGTPGYRCNVCPRNRISPGGAFADVLQCTPCPPGTTSDNGITCTPSSGFPRNSRCANIQGAPSGTPFVCPTGYNITRPSNALEGQGFPAAFTTCCRQDATLTFPVVATCADIDTGAGATPFTCGTSFTSSGSQTPIGGFSPSAALGACCNPKP